MNSYYLFSLPAEIKIFAVIDDQEIRYVSETYTNGVFFNDDHLSSQEMETLLKDRGNSLDPDRLLAYTEEIIKETEKILKDLGEEEKTRIKYSLNSLLCHLFNIREEMEI